MCHAARSAPPSPPDPGPVGLHGPVRLTSADGTRVPAYGARPRTPSRGSVIILPDVRGLHPFYQSLARRFAETGFTTLAVDLYGRTAPNNPRGDAFPWRDHVDHVRNEGVDLDVGAAAAYVRALDPGPVFTIGFCFGGGHSWRLAAGDESPAGAIGFYGLPHLVTGTLGRTNAPILMLLAGRDDETPRAALDHLTRRLDIAGAPYDVHVYADAPHSFFDRSHSEWADTCQDAWQRVLAFTDRVRHTRSGARETEL